MAACEITAVEAGWLSKSPTVSMCVSLDVGDYRPRAAPGSSFPPSRRPAVAAATLTPPKRRRLAAPRREVAQTATAQRHQQPDTLPRAAAIAPIEQLTSALLTAITPYLTLKDKLLHLTRLSHVFPALTPACFRCDHFNLTRILVDAIAASNRRQRLFSQLLSLSFVYHPPQPTHAADVDSWDGNDGEGEKVAGGEQQLRPLSPHHTLQKVVQLLNPPPTAAVTTSVFPALSALTVVLGPQHTQSSCSSLFASLPFLSHLSKLHFAMHDKESGERVTSSALSELRHCRSLRQLTLDKHAIDHLTFVLLCTLPLVYLDLSGTKLVRSLSSDATSPTASARLLDSADQRVGSSWHTVLLPKAKQEADEEVIDALLMAYLQCGDGFSGPSADRANSCPPCELPAVLRYLNCNSQISSGVYSSLASLTSLTTLDLDGVRINADTLEVSPFFTASLAPRLPHLVHFISPRNYRDVGEEDKDKQLQRVNQSYLSFLTAYSSQLRTLRLKVPDTCLCIDIVNAVFKCHQLRRLTLALYSYAYSEENTVDTADLPTTPAVPLVHLHFLKLHGLPLTDAGLAALLRACPNVDDLKLAKWDELTMDGLEAIGLCCPLLRRLAIKSCELVLASSGRELVGLQCVQNGYLRPDGSLCRIFPSLSILSIVSYRQGGEEGGGVNEYSPLDYSPPALRQLLSLLCCSSLAYLRLDIDLPTAELLIFKPLTHLRYLRTCTTLPDSLHRYFTERSDEVYSAAAAVEGQRLLSEERASEEAMRRKWLLKARVADTPSLFVSEAAFDGLTGREAFFEALALEQAEGCDNEVGEEECAEMACCEKQHEQSC